MSVLITALFLVAMALWLGASYRRVLMLRTQVANAWRRLEDAVWERHEVIGIIADTAARVAVDPALLDPFVKVYQRGVAHAKPSEAARLRRDLEAALARVVTALQQPATNDEAISEPLRKLHETDGVVKTANAAYDTSAQAYNAAITAFPGNVIASMGGFRRAQAF